MTVEAWLLTATTVIAVVAVLVAAFALRTVRRLQVRQEPAQHEPVEPTSTVLVPVDPAVVEPAANTVPAQLRPRVVQGRVIVPPTQAQVVRTALGRPGVRLNVLLFGLARALQAENRDHIVALMRREYRHRRRERLRAGRQAIRMAQPTSAPTTDRLHAHLAEPRQLTLTERMIGS